MNGVKKKRGRPLKDGARRHRFPIMMTDEEYGLLVDASKKSGKSMSEIARTGIAISARGESDLYDLAHEEPDEIEDFDEF